jgi:phage-related minor tail protein
MSSFARYYLNLFIEIFNDIVTFFKTIFGAIVSIFTNIGKYFTMLVDASKDFDVIAWILTVVVTVLNYTLLFFIGVRIFQVLKRYFIFRAKEVEKDQLIEEIAFVLQSIQY